MDDGHRAGLGLDLDWLTDTRTILGSAETCLITCLITCLMGWDLDVCQDWLTTTAARLARFAEKNS